MLPRRRDVSGLFPGNVHVPTRCPDVGGVFCVYFGIEGKSVWLDVKRSRLGNAHWAAIYSHVLDPQCNAIPKTCWKGENEVRYWWMFLEISAGELVGAETIIDTCCLSLARCCSRTQAPTPPDQQPAVVWIFCKILNGPLLATKCELECTMGVSPLFDFQILTVMSTNTRSRTR